MMVNMTDIVIGIVSRTIVMIGLADRHGGYDDEHRRHSSSSCPPACRCPAMRGPSQIWQLNHTSALGSDWARMLRSAESNEALDPWFPHVPYVLDTRSLILEEGRH